jgi:gamma-glutamyltranspeptidase/glutathione hydrolase
LATLHSKVSVSTSPVRSATWRGIAAVLALGVASSGCSTVGSLFGMDHSPFGSEGNVTGFLGAAVVDEPVAALTGRNVLSAGGDAVDAAVAIGFALAVTLPSRAGLGGGGACLAYTASSDKLPTPEAVLFAPVAPATSAGASRPAAVPMLARGLFTLHLRRGKLPFEVLVQQAETLAREGTATSRAFARDLTLVAGPLSADPLASRSFMPNGRPLVEGATLLQPELASTLTQLIKAGVGDMYQGALARRLSDTAPLAGTVLSLADLRGALAQTAAPILVPIGRDTAAFLPPPADGGLAAAAAFQALQAAPAALDAANARALAVAAQWRRSGGDPQAILTGQLPAASLPALPASTSFATMDKEGNAVVCALTMGNLFGTGRILPGTGILLAASPGVTPPPLLAAGIIYNERKQAFRAAAGGSGQAGAPLAVAIGLTQALAQTSGRSQPNPSAIPDPGRGNIIACSDYLPSDAGSCGWATDPRGAGLAAANN